MFVHCIDVAVSLLYWKKPDCSILSKLVCQLFLYLPCFSDDPEKFKEDLLNIARTTLSSKLLVHHRDHFSNLAVDAVLRLKVCAQLKIKEEKRTFYEVFCLLC